MKALRRTIWVFRLAWSLRPGLVFGILLTTLGRSLFPAAIALISRSLVNALVGAVGGGSVDGGQVLWWIALGFGATAIEIVSSGAGDLLRRRLLDELNIQISVAIMQHAATLDLPFFEAATSQDMLERLRKNAALKVPAYVIDLLDLVMNLVQLVSLLAILLVIEPFIAVVLPPILVPYFMFQWWLAREGYQIETRRTPKWRWAKYFVWATTDYRWVPEVKVLGLSPLLTARFRHLLEGFRDEDRRLYLLNFVGNTLFAVLATGAFYLLFARLVNHVLLGGATVGDVALYGGATVRLRGMLQTITLLIKSLREQMLYLADLSEFLETRSHLAGREESPLPDGNRPIVFENVSFTYAGSMQPALSNLSFTIEPGETVALVGENGAGKSTLVKLLARLYEPTAGRICFGGVEIATFSVEAWWQQISFVFQDFSRYEASAADNIAFGNQTLCLAQVQEVARRAGVDELIRSMPQGYDTQLGLYFSDYTLSSGQWQKLANARAFARQDSTLFILDEPTASLDARAEYTLFKQFRALAAGRTTVIISHRFNTVRIADRILVLKHGHLVESGSHDALLQQKGYYANLYHLHRQEPLPQRKA